MEISGSFRGQKKCNNPDLNQCWNIVNLNLRNKLSIEIHTFSFKKMHLKMLSAKWRQFCLGLNMLKLGYWEKVVAR